VAASLHLTQITQLYSNVITYNKCTYFILRPNVHLRW